MDMVHTKNWNWNGLSSYMDVMGWEEGSSKSFMLKKKIEDSDWFPESLAIELYAFGCTFNSCDTQMIHIVCINTVKLSCLPYIPFHRFIFWLHRTNNIPFLGASDQNKGLVHVLHFQVWDIHSLIRWLSVCFSHSNCEMENG